MENIKIILEIEFENLLPVYADKLRSKLLKNLAWENPRISLKDLIDTTQLDKRHIKIARVDKKRYNEFGIETIINLKVQSYGEL